MRPKVVVVGSLNIDYIASVSNLPAPGQTVPATGLAQKFGGKGANQAVAAARQGAAVAMLGCVGEDAHGEAYIDRLRAEGIATSGVRRAAQALTGTALIAVDRAAENTIIVAAGANGRLSVADVRRCAPTLRSAGAVLLQLEVPMATVVAAVAEANRAGVPVILNPSPLRPDVPWRRLRIDTLIVNEGEAAAIFQLPVAPLAARIPDWRKVMRQRNVRRLIVTRGARATVCLFEGGYLEVPALNVKPVDTVGAGDAFAGTFAARVVEGRDLSEAIRLANAAGGLATLKRGAQESIPGRRATERAALKPGRAPRTSRRG